MRRNNNARLTRELAGALLNSNLTDSELMDLCYDILDRRDVLNEVAKNIINIIDIKSKTSFGRTGQYSRDVQKKAQMAFSFLRNKGVTKDKLFTALSMFSRNMKNFIREENPTIKEAMEFFVDSTSQSDIELFMDSFNDDEFIKMIEGE